MQFRGRNTKRLTLAGWPQLHGQADWPTLRRWRDHQNFLHYEIFRLTIG